MDLNDLVKVEDLIITMNSITELFKRRNKVDKEKIDHMEKDLNYLLTEYKDSINSRSSEITHLKKHVMVKSFLDAREACNQARYCLEAPKRGRDIETLMQVEDEVLFEEMTESLEKMTVIFWKNFKRLKLFELSLLEKMKNFKDTIANFSEIIKK